ncbi:uncharacterized protein LOC143233203 [Tachypleus tridentatus]|uniref:uncharacterized protein LOC143233203 n=1 Tax=Tachypleus tridentatus TaxID=6853 RepID=UPI003FD4DA09
MPETKVANRATSDVSRKTIVSSELNDLKSKDFRITKNRESFGTRSPIREKVSRGKTHTIRRSQSISDLRVDSKLNDSSLQWRFSSKEEKIMSQAEQSAVSYFRNNPSVDHPRPKIKNLNNPEESYSKILHSNAEKVLSKLKTRQRVLSEVSGHPQDSKTRAKTQYQPAAPRKLQPLFTEDRNPAQQGGHEDVLQLPTSET